MALRNAGFSQQDMGALRDAPRRLLEGGAPLAERLRMLAADPSPHVQRLARFAVESRRRFCPRRRRGGGSED